MADKKSFVLYADYDEHFEELTDAELGQLFRSLFTYVNTGAVPEMERTVRMAFSFIRKNLDRDSEKYAETCKRRAEAGKKSGEARRAKAEAAEQEGTKRTIVQSVQQNEQEGTKRTDTDTETVTDTETDTVTEINNRGNSDESPSKKARFVPPTVEEVRDYCIERNNFVNPEAFVDFYSSKGWMVGKNKMKDWKAAVRTWEKGENRQATPRPARQPRQYSNPALDFLHQLEEDERGMVL